MFDFFKYKDNLIVISDKGESLTYAQMNDEIDLFYQSISCRGLLLCLCENSIATFVVYIACITKRIPFILIDGNKDRESIQHLIDVYQPEYLWLPLNRRNEFEGEILYLYEEHVLLQMKYVNLLFNKEINPNLLLCLTTSGSTGSPKLVRLSKKNLKSNAESIAEYLHIDETERPIMALPMYYSFGISIINSHLIRGATILLTNKSILQPEFWEFFCAQKATSFSGVPYTYEILKRLHFFNKDLPSLRYLTQAGGKLDATIVKEFVEYARAKDKRFIVMYGQTEASPRMSYLPFDRAIEKSASIGIAIPGGTFSIMGINGNDILESHVDGELVYKGENVCLGYAEKREDLLLGDENKGELHTGDIAHRDVDGFYYITGRKSRFVKVWGNRCNLDTVEQLVKTIVIDCACVGVDDKITIFVTKKGYEDKIQRLLIDRTRFNPSVFQIRIIKEIPKSLSGKIKRYCVC